MAVTIGGIAIDLQTNIAQLRSDLQRANQFTRASSERMATDLGRVERRFSSLHGEAIRFGNALGQIRTGLAFAAAGVGVSSLTSLLRDSVRATAQLRAEAERAGVSFQALQELNVVARAQNVSFDALIDGLKELSLRADEFVVTGAGPAAEAFQRLGFGAAELAERLEDPQELFFEIIQRMQEFDRAAQIRIADELFGGTGGEQFVQLLDMSVEAMRDMIREAREAGRILDDDIGAAAARVEARFQDIATAIDVGVKGAIVSASDALLGFLERLDRGAAFTAGGVIARDSGIGQMVAAGEGIRAIEEQIQATDRLIAMERERLALSQASGREASTAGLQALEAEAGRLRDRLVEARAALREVSQPSGLFGREALEGGASPKVNVRPTPVRDARRTERATRARIDSADRIIQQLRTELSLVGAANAEIQVANALRQAGAEATDAQRAEIESLVNAIVREEEALAGLEDAHQRVRDVAETGIRTFIDSLREGESMVNSLTAALDRMLERLADEALTSGLDALFGGTTGSSSGGIFGDLLGSITGSLTGSFTGAAGAGFGGVGPITGASLGTTPFSGLYASGGLIPKGTFGLVGEAGPEFVMSGSSGAIVTGAAETAKMLQALRSPTSFGGTGFGGFSPSGGILGSLLSAIGGGGGDPLESALAGIGGKVTGGRGSFGGVIGALTSGLSSIFSGFFADGGRIPTGQWGIVGEAGPEIVGASPSGAIVTSARQTASMLGGVGGRAELVVHLAEGLKAELAGQMEGVAVRVVQGGLAAYDRHVAPKTAERIRKDPLRRG